MFLKYTQILNLPLKSFEIETESDLRGFHVFILVFYIIVIFEISE